MGLLRDPMKMKKVVWLSVFLGSSMCLTGTAGEDPVAVDLPSSSSSISIDGDQLPPASSSSSSITTAAATRRKVTTGCATPYSSKRTYAAGDVVSNNGRNYSCKGAPYTLWCSNDNYEPGVGVEGYWTMVWTVLEDCQTQQENSNNATFQSLVQKKSSASSFATGIHKKTPSSQNNSNKKFGDSTFSVSKVQTAPIISHDKLASSSTSSSSSSSSNSNEMIPMSQTSIKYNSNSGGCAPPYELRPYSDGDMVSANGINYKCKPHPYTSWCGVEAYAPGTGYWYMAWTSEGECPTPQPTNRPGGLSSTGMVQDGIVYTSSSNNQGNDGICGQVYRPGANYGMNHIVSNRGTNYSCQHPEWCGKTKFEPGHSQYWTLVWDSLGKCTSMAAATLGAQPQVPAAVPAPAPAPISPNNPPSKNQKEPSKQTSNNNGRPVNSNRPKRPVNQKQPSSSVSTPKEEAGTDWSNFILDVLPEEDQQPQGIDSCPPGWVLEYSYDAGETVGANGQIFSCKGYPHTGWCGMNAAYQPILGAHWQMAWDVTGSCVGGEIVETPKPTPLPTRDPTPKPTPRPTRDPSEPQVAELINPVNPSYGLANDEVTVQRVFDMLDAKASAIDSTLFLYQGSEPSTVYRYEGFRAGLEIMYEDGVAGKHFYLGNGHPENGHLYGLVNIAAFIGQSMKETIQYDACDENSWDYYNMVYPLSNSCGQLGQSYQDYHCPDHEKHMECEVDPNMSIRATTHAKWYGAPGPLFCGPKSEYPQTGIWDYSYSCHNPWADPPEYCTDYEGQKAGREDNSEPVANRNGRTDVEGCCWWGRGVIQTTGICNFGKLNYFLGKRAADDGRDSRYPEIDFCKDPGIICSSQEHKELKWLAGMFYWIESLQSYDEGGWNYMEQLHKFVDNGMDDHSFINAVSGIVNRGCHDPPCGTGPVDGEHERAGNFQKVLSTIS